MDLDSDEYDWRRRLRGRRLRRLKVKVAYIGLLDYRAYRVPELIPVLGSQPAGDVSRRLPLLSARPAVTPATLKRAATNFAVW